MIIVRVAFKDDLIDPAMFDNGELDKIAKSVRTYEYVAEGSLDEWRKALKLSVVTHAVVVATNYAKNQRGMSVARVIEFDEMENATFDGVHSPVVTMFGLDQYVVAIKRRDDIIELERKIASRRKFLKKERELDSDAEKDTVMAEFVSKLRKLKGT